MTPRLQPQCNAAAAAALLQRLEFSGSELRLWLVLLHSVAASVKFSCSCSITAANSIDVWSYCVLLLRRLQLNLDLLCCVLLPQVLQHLELLQAQQGAGSSDQAELVYLRQRVRQLMLENRAARRQAVRAQLAAATSAGQLAISDGGVSTAVGASERPSGDAAAATDSSVEEARAEVPGNAATRQVTPTPPAAPSGTPAAPPFGSPSSNSHALRRQLRRVTAQLATLQDENSRLMDMSNALRAERDRLVLQVRKLHLYFKLHVYYPAVRHRKTCVIENVVLPSILLCQH